MIPIDFYACPMCQEVNEEHRTYCKNCGTWLLNTHYPAKLVKRSRFPRPRYDTGEVKQTWLIVLVSLVLGAAAILTLISLAMDKGTAILYSLGIIFSLLGVAFVILTLIAVLVWAASRGRYASGRAVGLLFIVGISIFVLGIFLTATAQGSTGAGSRSGTSSLGGQGNSALSGSLRNEFGVYGLQMGDSQDKVISRLGAPTRKDFQRISQGTAGSVYDYGNELSFTFLNGRIINIASRDPEFGTKRGASIGDSFDRVLSLYRGYPMNTNQDHSALLLRDRDSNLLLFTFSYNRLNAIQLLDTKGMNAISNSIWDAVFDRSIKINPDGTYQYPGSLN